jgi:3-phosphoshikimate 1-carboxyvinyltransferase
MIELDVPSSKSVTQRALVLAALGDGESRILRPLDCDDARALLGALAALGVPTERSEDALVLAGRERLRAPEGTLDLGNAGTAVRFTSALALLADGPVRIDGDPAMRRRPMPGLLAALGALGARAEEQGRPGCPPVTIFPPKDLAQVPREVTLDTSGSSQQLSALMLVAPRLPRGLRILLRGGLPSRPYVDLTAQVLRDFGAEVTLQEGTHTPFELRVAHGLGHRTYEVEGDHSSASYPLAAGFLTGLPVRVRNTRPDSLQGDRAFATLLEALASPPPARSPRVFDLERTPDIAPTLATCALFAKGATLLTGCAHLRIKESDRLAVLARGFRAVGADLDEREDGLLIRPRALHGGACLDPAHDHRMAMCFALLGLRLPEIEVLDPACVSKSYPGFFDMLTHFQPASR